MIPPAFTKLFDTVDSFLGVGMYNFEYISVGKSGGALLTESVQSNNLGLTDSVDIVCEVIFWRSFPKLVMKMFGWLAEGYINQLSSKAELDSEALYKEFDEFTLCVDLLRNNLYKEEYLP